MAASNERWIDNLQFSSLFCPPPQDAEQRNAQVNGYVDFFSQFISEQFPDDLAELIQSRYPCNEHTLLDDALATFVLHHPDHSRAVILPIISCIIDGLLEYDKRNPPFSSLISLLCPKTKVYSEQLVLACGEILRILTHYNRPIDTRERQLKEEDGSGYVSRGSASESTDKKVSTSYEKKLKRLLSPWITDILLELPLGIRSDYFRWCGGVGGTYTATELEPPPKASSHGSGKHPVLVKSTPKWAVANGAAVILSVCDEEVARYQTCTLTAAAVPAVLLPPATASKDEHPVAGLPTLEPYARLFHRYFANASPSVAHTLLLELLEAPPYWAHYALESAVQLVELLRAADDSASDMRLPGNWMYSYFLRAIGVAMSMLDGIAADAAAALLFRILSHPTLIFPPTGQVDAIEAQTDQLGSRALAEATAQGIASMLCEHGLEVEWRICMIWEAAYGLVPLRSSSTNLPEIVVATSLQRPILSWSLYVPLLEVLEYLPRGSPSESCLMKIFVATIEEVLQKTRNVRAAELRTIFHSLFLGCASAELASRLLFIMLTVCISHEGELMAAFDSYVIAAVCALSFELHTYSLISKQSDLLDTRANCGVIYQTRRVLAILEALVSSKPLSSIGSSNEMVATVMAAAHISELFRRSKVCMQALSLLMKRKWDKEARSRAYSLFSLIDIHCKTVASIIDKAEVLQARAMHASSSCIHGKKRKTRACCFHFESGQASTLFCEKTESKRGEAFASGLASFLTVEAYIGFKCRAEVIRSVLADKHELCVLVVSLLWNVLIVSPEIQPRAESSSAHQGWRKVVDALSIVVSASPATAATTVVVQADSELKPWIVEDGDLRQKTRRINRRIVKVIAELMNNHKSSESLMIMASSSDILFRATDGILVDEEACILPQLELLEATARAVEPVLEYGESGLEVAGDISKLLKCRLPATVQCVSHPSAHVRALSTSLLRAISHVGSWKSSCPQEKEAPGKVPGTNCQCSTLGTILDLREAVEKCLAWETRSRLATGLPVHLLEATAKELGFTIST